MDNGFTSTDKQWFREFLTRFEEVRVKTDTSATVRCPDPYHRHNNHDATPSLDLDLVQNGSGSTILGIDRSQGCDFESEILPAVGLSAKDLYPNDPAQEKGPNALPGLTVAEYAAAKNLDAEFLQSDVVGLEDRKYYCKVRDEKVPAIWIPYMDESGNQVAIRYRTGLRKPKTGDDTRFRWAKGADLTLYGRNWLDIAQEQDFAFLVEGESDCHIAWSQNIPAVGIPGSKNWKDEWAVFLDGIGLLIVTVEDEAGEELWTKVSNCKRLSGRLEREEVK